MREGLKNEKGGVLILVLMISAVLAVFVPVLLSMTSSTGAYEKKNRFEKQAVLMAVGTMQSFLQYPGSHVEQKEYLTRQYGHVRLQTPQNAQVDVYMYALSVSATSEDYADRMSKNALSNHTGDYKAALVAVIGDPNQNRVQDVDEPFFHKKKLVHLIRFASGKTDMPWVDPPPKEGNRDVNGYAEPDAEITVRVYRTDGTFKEEVTGTADTASDGDPEDVMKPFDVNVSSLSEDERVEVTARAPGKNVSEPFFVYVLNRNAPDDYIYREDENGDLVPVSFEDHYSTDEKMVIRPGFGEYSTNDSVRLNADDGIEITGTSDTEVGITTNSNGNDVGAELTTEGDIVMKHASLTDTANSRFGHIHLQAGGDVILTDVELTVERDISIEAGGNIVLTNVRMNSYKNNGAITLTLLDDTNHPEAGVIQLDAIRVNKDAQADPATGEICGSVESGTVNGLTYFPCD